MLKKIADQVRIRIAEDQKTLPLKTLEDGPRRTPHDFGALFAGDKIRIIAEVKLASPSEGDIAPHSDPVMVARDYLASGAAALSVLTERDYFKGSPDYLRGIRKAHPEARLLMKDFVIDPYQIHRALYDGADAVLLIVALLGEERTTEFLTLVHQLGLQALVEVHDEAELKSALTSGARLIGVNNRNLKTMEVDVETSQRLARLKPENATFVSESGLKTPEDLRRLHKAGYSGFLMGTHFMKTADPGLALREILQAVQA